ncbi:MAG: hypothetical protein WCN87_04555 [Chlamydiota bacterium]
MSGLITGITRDINTLNTPQTSPLSADVREVLQNAVYLRIAAIALGVFSALLLTTVLVVSAIALPLSPLVITSGIIFGVFLGILSYDAAIVGRNRGDMCHASITGEGLVGHVGHAIVAGAKAFFAGKPIGENISHDSNYKDTLIMGHIMNFFG